MKLKLTLAILALAALGGFILFRVRSETPSLAAYASEAFGIRFKYPKNYVLETKELGDGHRGHFAIILTEDTEENRLVREGKAPPREGPTAIIFDLYQSPETLDPLTWVKGHSGSNFKLSDETYSTISVADKSAIAYTWDGLYRGDTVVIQHRDYMAAIAVTYLAPEDTKRNDFAKMLKTLKFF